MPSPYQQPSGSVGMFVGMLVMVVALSGIAVAIGYFCSGRRRMGTGEYDTDMERWAERKCSSCIDGRIPGDDVPKDEANKQAL